MVCTGPNVVDEEKSVVGRKGRVGRKGNFVVVVVVERMTRKGSTVAAQKAGTGEGNVEEKEKGRGVVVTSLLPM